MKPKHMSAVVIGILCILLAAIFAGSVMKNFFEGRIVNPIQKAIDQAK